MVVSLLDCSALGDIVSAEQRHCDMKFRSGRIGPSRPATWVSDRVDKTIKLMKHGHDQHHQEKYMFDQQHALGSRERSKIGKPTWEHMGRTFRAYETSAVPRQITAANMKTSSKGTIE